MTVEELIAKLKEIDDPHLEVIYYDSEDGALTVTEIRIHHQKANGFIPANDYVVIS